VSAADRVCVIAGVGPGTGAALSRRFAREGFRVAMLARTAERLEKLEAELPGCRGYPVDYSEEGPAREVYARIEAELGTPEVLVHNGAAGSFRPFMELRPEVLERNFRTNTMSLLYLGQEAARRMLERGSGSIIVTGNTAAWRGKANFAGFAPTKAAQRILAQSMARSLGPQGIHVAYVVIDAVIDLPWTRQRNPDAPDDFFIKPDAIADTVWQLTQQDRSGWSFEVDLRPFGERW
jgi:NAD(P)-dependent dehydrogenase (short-subunit alcohol dehydrogenase family)